MPDYRCPKHDLIFTSLLDHRRPGTLKQDGNFPPHPVNGHPDCPVCQRDEVEKVTGVAPDAPGTEFHSVLVEGK